MPPKLTVCMDKKKRKKKLSCPSKYELFDENFMSRPKNFPILKRFLNFIQNENLSDEDLQNTVKIQRLLMHAFSNNLLPNEEYVQSIQTLFSNTKFSEFKRNLYKYSEYIATYLWVDKIQKIVIDPEEKNRILKGEPVNSNGHMLYCILTETIYEEKSKTTLAKDPNIQLFKNILRCKEELGKSLANFIKDHFQDDFNQDEKDEILNCTKNFLSDRLRYKKSRRFRNSPAFDMSHDIETLQLRDDFESGDDGDVEEVEEDDLEVGSTAQEIPSSSEHAVTRTLNGNLIIVKRKASVESPQPSTSTFGTNKRFLEEKRRKKDGRDEPQECHSTLSKTPIPTTPVVDWLDRDNENQEQQHDDVGIKDEPQIQISNIFQLPEDIDFKDEPIPQSSSTRVLTSDESLINNHRSTIGISILDEFYKKWLDQTECDVEFTASDDRTIKAHNIVLRAASLVFSDQVDPIRLADLSYDVAEEMLHFIYTGKFKNLDQNKVDGLLLAATKYKIRNLKIVCEKFLRKNLSIENALITLKLCKKHELDELKKYAKAFIDSFVRIQCDSS